MFVVIEERKLMDVIGTNSTVEYDASCEVSACQIVRLAEYRETRMTYKKI